MVLNYDEVLKLKNAVLEKYDIYIHFHDSCSGQYFTTDSPIVSEAVVFITNYFKEMGATAIFNEDNTLFYTENFKDL